MKIDGNNNWVVILNDDGSKSDPLFLCIGANLETNADNIQGITEAEAKNIIALKPIK